MHGRPLALRGGQLVERAPHFGTFLVDLVHRLVDIPIVFHAWGTSSVNFHGRPARKSSAAASFVITAICVRLSARYCSAT